MVLAVMIVAFHMNVCEAPRIPKEKKLRPTSSKHIIRIYHTASQIYTSLATPKDPYELLTKKCPNQQCPPSPPTRSTTSST